MSNQTKILFISSNFPPVIGGSAVVYDQLCRNSKGRLVAVGASCDYRTGQEWKDLAEADLNRGYAIHRLPFLRPPAYSTDSTTWLGRLVRLVFRDLPVMARVLIFLITLIIKYRVKVICLGELIYGGWLVFPLRYVLRRKVLIYTHGEEISQDSENFLARRRGLFLSHAHKIVAVSIFCKGQIISKYRVAPDKICVVNNGVDLNAYTLADPTPNVWPKHVQGSKIILSVSRLVERKGQETLVRAMPAVIAAHPDAHCVIVGGGPMEQKLRETAYALGMAEHCTVVGAAPQADVLAYFRSCTLFALPCHTLADGDTEGFGLVFLEAGACGKPVVAGVAGGTIEAVTDGKTGILVDGTSAEQVYGAITKLLSNPEYANSLGKEGRRRAQNCSWNSVAQHFLRVCGRGAIEERPPSYRLSNGASPNELLSSMGPSIPNLLVTVDVEEEFGWEEFNRLKHKVRGASELRLFHNDCRSTGISPVYLLTYPILMDEAYRSFLKEVVAKKEAEVGIHLHSWTAPPYWEQPNAFTSYQCNLPEHVERRKLESLCTAFEECFGSPVLIHRAGRWGGSERTSEILEHLNIEMDLSPSTGYSDDASGGPDFSNIDGSPFWSGSHKSVLTIPASSINFLRGPAWLSSINFALSHRFADIRSHLRQRGKPVRFSPENANEATLFAMARELGLRRLPTAVYTLHSTSLYLDGNPYSAGEGKAELLRRRSLTFLARAIESNLVRPTTCEELLKSARSSRVREPLTSSQ